jgi:hypothetical protein
MSKFSDATFYLSPSGYKEGFIFPQKPLSTNGDVSFVRAGSAWRTTIEGQIEESPYNLFSYSEDFSNGYWLKANITLTANQAVAPNNTYTATLWDEGTVSGVHRLLSYFTKIILGENYTLSMYVKKNTMRYCRLTINAENNTAIWAAAQFDLDTATYTTGVSSVTGATVVSASIQSVGNGWFRLTFTGSIATDGIYPGFFGADGTTINPADNGRGGSGYVGTNKQLYIWGAQLVRGSLPKNYLATTNRQNFPRIDYSLGSGSLLLEPQRTNLVLQSKDFTSATWSKYGAGVALAPVVTANSGLSPEGMNTATRIQFNCVGNTVTDRSIMVQSIAITNGVSHASSFYIKAYSPSEIGKQVRFIAEQASPQVIVTLTSDWQKVNVSSTSVNVSTNFILETRGTVTTNTTADILLWGVQFEQGTYSTTFIPTTTASVTRLVDSFSRNNLYTNNLISASGGTWFIQLNNTIPYVRDSFAQPLFIADAASGFANGIGFRTGTGTSMLLFSKVIASVESLVSLGTFVSTLKLVIKWNGTTADLFVNGVKQVSATAFTPTNMNFLIGNAVDVPKFIQQTALWNTPLTDAQCIEITS